MAPEKTTSSCPAPHRHRRTHRRIGDLVSRVDEYATIIISESSQHPQEPSNTLPTEEPHTYTAVTAEVLERHDTYQSFIHNQSDPAQGRSQQMNTYLNTIQTLDMYLAPQVRNQRSHHRQPEVGMASQQPATLRLHQQDSYSLIQQPSMPGTQDLPSSGEVQRPSDTGYFPHSETTAQNAVYWISQDDSRPSGDIPLGNHVANWEYDLAGVASQFDTDNNSNDVYIPYVNSHARSQG